MYDRVAFTVYPVTDLARARAFYEETLGLPGLGLVVNEHGQGWVEYDLPGGGCFALTTFLKGHAPGATAGMVAFEVADLAALTTRLRAEGVAFQMEPTDFPTCSWAIVHDSEGNAVVLHQHKRS
ncbi:MAG: VOC family protein [Planctomycetes bacterium]|nr:VOC family protein [Planctomycetota bacterium]